MLESKNIQFRNHTFKIKFLLLALLIVGIYYTFHHQAFYIEVYSKNGSHLTVLGKGICHHISRVTDKTVRQELFWNISRKKNVPGSIMNRQFDYRYRKFNFKPGGLSGYSFTLRFPLWIMYVMVLAFIGFRVYKKRKLVSLQNPCESCQYDLTGNTSGKCPECGTEFDLENLVSSNSTI